MHLLQIAAAIGCATGALGWDKYATERGYAGTQDPREQGHGGYGSYHARDAEPEALAAWEEDHGGKAPLHQPSFSHGAHWARDAQPDPDAGQYFHGSDSYGEHHAREAEPERNQYLHESQGYGGHHARDAAPEPYYIQPTHKAPSYAQHHARAAYNVENQDGYGGFGHEQQLHARGVHEYAGAGEHYDGGYPFGGQHHHARDASAHGAEHFSDEYPFAGQQHHAREAFAHGDEYRTIPGHGSPHVNMRDQHGHHAHAVPDAGFADQRQGGRQPPTPTFRGRHFARQASNVTIADTALNTASVAAQESGADFQPSAFDPRIPQADTAGTQFSRRDAGVQGSYIGGGNFDGHRPHWAGEADAEPGMPAHNFDGSSFPHRPHHARGVQPRPGLSGAEFREDGLGENLPNHARDAEAEAFRSGQQGPGGDFGSAAHRPHQAREAPPAVSAPQGHAQASKPKQKSGWGFPW